MDPEVAGLVTAVGGVLLGILGWVRRIRKDNDTRETRLFKQYEGLVAELRDEISRLRADILEERAECAKRILALEQEVLKWKN